jgi:hypothetical protein
MARSIEIPYAKEINMPLSTRKIHVCLILTIIICSALIISGCSALQSVGKSGPEVQSGSPEEEFDEIDLSGDEGESSDQEASADDPLTGFTCPESPETFELWSSYDIKFKTPGFGTWDITGSGGQLVSIAEGATDKAAYGLHQNEVRIPGFVKAEFSRDDQKCQFEQDLEIISQVSGKCQNGVIMVSIVTNFGEANTPMTCCVGEDCTTNPFMWLLPVVTYKIELSEANGFTMEKEFTGGEGYMSWKLQGVMLPVPID